LRFPDLSLERQLLQMWSHMTTCEESWQMQKAQQTVIGFT